MIRLLITSLIIISLSVSGQNMYLDINGFGVNQWCDESEETYFTLELFALNGNQLIEAAEFEWSNDNQTHIWQNVSGAKVLTVYVSQDCLQLGYDTFEVEFGGDEYHLFNEPSDSWFMGNDVVLKFYIDTETTPCELADLNNDGRVNTGDLTILLSQYGLVCN